MSRFNVLLVVGLASGILAGGALALCVSHTNQRSTATADSSAQALSLNERGLLLMSGGNLTEATPLFGSAFGLVPDPAYALNLATSLFRQGELDSALMALDAVRLAKPTSKQLELVENMRGTLLVECMRRKIECYARSSVPSSKPRGASPSLVEALRLKDLGMAELHANQMDPATRLFEQSLSVHPTSIVRLDLAIAYFHDERFDRATALLRTLLASEPGEPVLRKKAEELLVRAREACVARSLQCAK